MEIRDLAPDDLDAALDIRTRSFGEISGTRQEQWRRMMRRSMDQDGVLGAYHDGHLVAMARIHRFGQWWHGRTLPMAGIGGVVVAPEYRGRGVGRRLMLGVLERCAAAGFRLSVLYPATVPLYRSCGWELGGGYHTVSVPAEALRTLSTDPVPVRRVGPDDAAEIVAVVRRIHTDARSSGPVAWDEPEVRAWLTDYQPYTYLAEDGFLAYQWSGNDLEVEELVAGSGETARTLWALVGTGSSIAKTVKATIGPDDPLHWLTTEPVVRAESQERWMLRLLDVPAALAERGYPAGVEAEVTVVVDDPQLPRNTGAWRLSVGKGTGRVTQAGSSPGDSRLGSRGLAALYAGIPIPTLRAAGLLTGGDPDTDALLDAVFAARPYLVDYF